MKTVKIQVYSINELPDNAKQKAILEHLDFLQNTSYTTDTEEDIEDRQNMNEEDALESILLNEYLFFENGELIPRYLYKTVVEE